MEEVINQPKTLKLAEEERLQALKNYNILDTLPEADFDALTKLASYICQTPIALITLLDSERQWFKSNIGLKVLQTPREIAFCRHTIEGQTVFEIQDAHQVELVKENPLVTGDPNIRFYAGAPLTTPLGYNIGALCVIDTIPRQLSDEQKTALQTLAREVVSHLELRASKAKLELENRRLEKYHMWFSHTKELMCVVDSASFIYEEVNQSFKTMLGYGPEEIRGKPLAEFIYPQDLQPTIEIASRAAAEKLVAFEFENRMICKDSSLKWISWSAIAKDGKWYADGRDITEKKQLKILLQETQQMASVGGWELDLATRQLFWTEQLYHIHELPTHCQIQFLDAIHYYQPDAIPVISKAVDRAIQYGEPYDLELQQTTAKGKNIWVRTIGRAVVEHGKIVKLKGTLQDITARKQIEASQELLLEKLAKSNSELQQKEKYLREINNLATLLINQGEWEETAWEVPANIVKELGLSSCSVLLLNEKKQYLIRRATYTSIGVEKFDKAAEKIPLGVGLIGTVGLTGITSVVNDISLDARFAGKSYDYASMVAIPIIADGAILGVLTSTHAQKNFFTSQHLDILSTIANLVASSIKYAVNYRRKKATEQALRESEEQTRLIIDTALDGVIITNNEGVISNWNSQAAKIFGWSKEEAMNQPLTELIIPEPYREAHRQGLARYITKGEYSILNRRIEVTALRKNGEEFPMELTVSPIHSQSGIQFSAFVRDITEQKNIQRDLLNARIKAEESSKAKETFLANMSHEIRTPMNAIIGMSNLIADTSLNPKQQSYLEAIKSSASNLLVIINDLLDFSKIESGKLVLETIGFSLQDTVRSLIQSISYKADEKGIALTFKADPEIRPVLLGDPVRLNQVLLNLVNNALKFTSQGYVDLSCTLLRETALTQQIEFKVKDTGIGISKHKFQTIYESFCQEDESITRRFGGTGLGLSISKEIVELMGGRIEIESEKNKGSSFSFVLEFVKGQPEDMVQVQEEKKNISLEGVKLLLVEDHDINRFLAISILNEWNVAVDVAENGLLAVEKVKAEKYDLILMDMQMPVMSGLEATAIIRHELRSDVPIIALTANANKTDITKCIRSGMDDYITKPFNPSHLFNKIAEHLHRQEILASEARPVEQPATEKLFDLGKLHELYGGKQELITNLVAIFKNNTPLVLAQLNEYYTHNQLREVAKLAHQLKPSIDFMGISKLSTDIRLLEKCEQKNAREIQVSIQKVNEVLAQVIRQLEIESAT